MKPDSSWVSVWLRTTVEASSGNVLGCEWAERDDVEKLQRGMMKKLGELREKRGGGLGPVLRSEDVVEVTMGWVPCV